MIKIQNKVVEPNFSQNDTVYGSQELVEIYPFEKKHDLIVVKQSSADPNVTSVS